METLGKTTPAGRAKKRVRKAATTAKKTAKKRIDTVINSMVKKASKTIDTTAKTVKKKATATAKKKSTKKCTTGTKRKATTKQLANLKKARASRKAKSTSSRKKATGLLGGLKNYKQRKYLLSYQDKKGNELTTGEIWALNLTEANKTAKKILATTMMNDLKKVVVKLKR